MITENQSAAHSSLDFSDVESTSLLTLYSRAIESRSREPILVDKQAEQLVDQIDRQIAGTEDRLLRMLHRRDFDPRLVVHIALRAHQYDEYAREFLSRYPNGVVVNLGCGMDTRFYRIDDGCLTLFDLDLPEVIRFKRRLLPEGDRYHMIAASVFDYHWMDQVAAATGGRRVVFLAEGVLMYLDPDKVKQLVQEMQRRFPGSEMACEVVDKRWVSGIYGRIAAGKMQGRLKFGKGTQYHFGVASPDEMESWGTGIEYIDHWSYFDSDHPKLGWMRVFRHVPFMRNVQYTVRYRFT